MFIRHKSLVVEPAQTVPQSKKLLYLGKVRRLLRSSVFMMLMSVLLALSVFAEEDREGEFGGSGFGGSISDGLSSVTSATDTIVSLLSKVWTAISGNPVLVVFLAATLFTVAIAVFRRLKRAVR